MNVPVRRLILTTCSVIACAAFTANPASAAKPAPAVVIEQLQEGNARFVHGQSLHPNLGHERIELAGRSNQGDYALATVISCSDSRVPVEAIFDAGIMDLFVIRVAGNVVDVDEAGSIEYGLAHVNTPVMVVLGHTQCGAVTAVTHAVEGHGHPLEINIPPLVENITPAVERAKAHTHLNGAELIPHAIEENVWHSIEELFMRSPKTRELVHSGQVQVVGAIYNVGTGEISWLDAHKVATILADAEANPAKETRAMASAEPAAPHAVAQH